MKVQGDPFDKGQGPVRRNTGSWAARRWRDHARTSDDTFQEVYLRLFSKQPEACEALRHFTVAEFSNYYREALAKQGGNLDVDISKTVCRRGTPISLDAPTGNGAAMDLPDPASVNTEPMFDDEIETIHRAIALLPAKERAVIRLRWFHDFTDKEIARQLNLVEGSVRVYAMRALNKLRTLLGPQFGVER